MPADVKPLFRPDALRPKLAGFTVPPAALAARPKLAEWVKLLASDAGKKRKETELLADFLRIFGPMGTSSERVPRNGRSCRVCEPAVAKFAHSVSICTPHRAETG